MDRLDEAAGVDFFEQVTVGAGPDRFINKMIIRHGSEDQHAGFGPLPKH